MGLPAKPAIRDGAPRGRHLAGLIAACLACLAVARGDDWPQWLGPQRDDIWREDGILDKFPAGGPPVRWRAEVGGGYSGPSVAEGKVFVTDRVLGTGATNPTNPFARGSIPGFERIQCFDQTDGRLLWKHSYDCSYTVSYPAGPRTTPLVRDGMVYTVGAEGNLICLETATGRVAWSKNFKSEFGATTPTWGFAGNPIMDGNRVICLAGGTNATVAAFDAKTGKTLWTALDDKNPGYSSPMIFDLGGKRQLIVWSGDSVSSVNLESGEVNWTVPFKIRYGMSVASPRAHDSRLFITAFYDGALMLAFEPGKAVPSTVWQSTKRSEMNTDALHAILCPPVFDGDHIYGVCSYGQLRCLKSSSGERLWETFQATVPSGQPARWANAFLTRQSGRYFLFNENGDLIIAKLSPEGYSETSRAHLIDPTDNSPGRAVAWSHPAFAGRTVFARNDKELIAVSLAK